jgi:hypothetical protein
MSYEHEKDGVERRAAPRAEVPNFEGSLADQGSEIRCRISNLSRLGACAVSSHALPEMTRVKVRFLMEAPDADPRSIACEAAVVRCQKRTDGLFDVGLFFTTMRADDRVAIDQLASRGSPLSVRSV